MRDIAEIGTLLRGKYCLLEKIGSGGEGVVYLARDVHLGRLWCVKIGEISEGQKIFCRLGCDRIPQAVDYWEEGERAYLVMEYIRGCPLKERLGRGKVSEKLRMRWSRQLLSAVKYLHGQKPPVVHGDLKPENLLISREENLYLIDFGSAAPADGGQVKTRKGTRESAAPEQAEGLCTVQSDIHGIGNVLQSLWKGHLRGNWRLLYTIRKALRKKPRDRYRDCERLQRDMERAFRSRNRGRAPLFLLLMAAVGFLPMAGSSQGQFRGEESGRLALSPAERGREVTLEAVHDAAVHVFRMDDTAGSGAGAFQDAKSLGQTLLAKAQGDRKSHLLLLLAQLCQANDDRAGAASFYRIWMEKYPDGTEGRILYGLLLLRQGEREASRRLYEECRELLSGEDSHNYQIWTAKLAAESDGG